MRRPRIDLGAEAWFWATVAAAALPAAGFIGLVLAFARSAPPQTSALRACVLWMQGHAGQGLLALLIIAMAAPAVAVAASAVRRVRATRRWLRLLDVLEAPAWGQGAWRRVEDSGLAGRAQLVDLPLVGSWAVGLWRPRVVLTTGLLKALTDDELAAVLDHEVHHLRRRDPLKALLAHALRDGVGWIPAVTASAATYALHCELAADNAALRRSPAATLRRALLKCERGRQGGPAAGIFKVAAPSFTNSRRARLARLDQTHPEAGGRRPVALAWAETVLATLMAWGLVMAACTPPLH